MNAMTKGEREDLIRLIKQRERVAKTAAAARSAAMRAQFEQQVSAVALTPVGAGTRVMRLFDTASMAGCWAVQLFLGDGGPLSNKWSLDAVTVNYTKDQAVV